MKKYVGLLLLIASLSASGQPLRDINYEYLYNPEAPLSFELKAVRGTTEFTVLYDLQTRDTSNLATRYSIEWEGRALLSDKEGEAVVLNNPTVRRHASGFEGQGTISITDAPRYLVVKIVHTSERRAWLYFTRLESNYPVNNFLKDSEGPVTTPFLKTNETVSVGFGSEEWFVSYYDDNFPAAAPAFSEAQARVSRGMQVDSTYRVKAGDQINFSRKGLYLLQRDTNALEGFAFRAEDDYPQYTKISSLAAPLIYITTRQEYDRLEAVQGNKKAFDRIILSITVDTDRARILMRNYFRRVELANRYFTSYKEGWKTDRGMTYIIFGKPDEVFRFDDREVWRYDNSRFDNISFSFARSTSLFDPENYVLLREKKYEDTWYEVIDLWRNARF